MMEDWMGIQYSDRIELRAMRLGMAIKDSVAVVRRYFDLMRSNDFNAVAAVLAAEFVLEWPLSNERIRGAAAYAAMNAAYPAHGPWTFEVHRLVGGEGE